MRTQGGTTGGAAPPTAAAGADQTQNGLALVSLSGTGSTAGVTYSWALTAPDLSDQTGLLSDASAATPGFVPTIPGNWTAVLTVTLGGVSAQDTVNIRVGDVDGWLRLNPNEATAGYSGGNHTTVTWADDNADWTTVTLSQNAVGTINPTDYEIKWVTSSVANAGSVGSIEYKLISDESYTQPAASNYCFGGIIVGERTTPGAAFLGFNSLQTIVNIASGMKRSMRGGNGNIAWSGSQTGKDAVFGTLSLRPYYGEMRRVQYYSTEVSGVSHVSGTEANSAVNQDLGAASTVYIGLVAGRTAGTGDQTFRYQVWYRINRR